MTSPHLPQIRYERRKCRRPPFPSKRDEAGPDNRSQVPAPFWQPIVVFLGWLALLYLVYRHVHILFSRNENCWLQMDVQEGIPGVLAKLRFAFTNSYNGHYTPLFFLPGTGLHRAVRDQRGVVAVLAVIHAGAAGVGFDGDVRPASATGFPAADDPALAGVRPDGTFYFFSL